MFARAVSDALDTSQGIGTYLYVLEPRSLTMIHEMLHLAYPSTFRDLGGWIPPFVMPITLQDGTVTPAWPGNPKSFQSSSTVSPPGCAAVNPNPNPVELEGETVSMIEGDVVFILGNTSYKYYSRVVYTRFMHIGQAWIVL
jgi:hypothetical protein